MSVLLDALKKAAEEKRKADQGKLDNAVDSQQVDSSSIDETTSEVDTTDKEVSYKPELKLKLSSGTNEVIKESASDDETDKSNDTQSTATSLPSSTDETVRSSNQTTVSDDNVIDENKVVEDTEIKLSLQPNSSKETQSSELLNALDAQTDLPVFDENASGSLASSQKTVQSTQSPSQDKTQSEIGTIENSAVNETKSSETSEQEASFDWRMDELPAYQEPSTAKSIDDTPPLESNSILTQDAAKPPKKKKTRASFALMMAMFVLLAFLVIGLYALIYYQEKNTELENSMKKYELTKIQLNDTKTENSANTQNTQTAVEKRNTENIQDTAKVGTEKSPVATNEINVTDAAQIEAESASAESVVNKQITTEKETFASDPKSSSQSTQSMVSNSKKTANDQSLAKAPVRVNKTESQRIIKAEPVAPSKEQNNLALAYQAYEQGNYPVSQWGFNQVLADNPDNINAMLGLAAIEVTKGNNFAAVKRYQEVLEKDPNNLYAYEAIANLSGSMQVDAQWQEDLLRMSEKYPKSSAIQFALGNSYANDNDWLNAQTYYFNAYVLSPKNPNHVMNLAVSFDRLGKYDLANRYYIEALGLTETKPAQFDEQAVRDRLISIRQLMLKGQ